jgi:hypothetical protein
MFKPKSLSVLGGAALGALAFAVHGSCHNR